MPQIYPLLLTAKINALESFGQKLIYGMLNWEQQIGENLDENDNGFQLLIIFAKRFVLNVWQGSEYASDCCDTKNNKTNQLKKKRKKSPSSIGRLL